MHAYGVHAGRYEQRCHHRTQQIPAPIHHRFSETPIQHLHDAKYEICPKAQIISNVSVHWHRTKASSTVVRTEGAYPVVHHCMLLEEIFGGENRAGLANGFATGGARGEHATAP
jgi:hypothetical protein